MSSIFLRMKLWSYTNIQTLWWNFPVPVQFEVNKLHMFRLYEFSILYIFYLKCSSHVPIRSLKYFFNTNQRLQGTVLYLYRRLTHEFQGLCDFCSPIQLVFLIIVRISLFWCALWYNCVCPQDYWPNCWKRSLKIPDPSLPLLILRYLLRWRWQKCQLSCLTNETRLLFTGSS